MEDSPHLYISEIGDNEDMEEGEEEEEEDDDDDDVHQGENDMQPDMITSLYPDLHEPPNEDTERDWNSFSCQHCERHFTSKQGLERHMHVHALEKNKAHACSHQNNMSFGSNLSQSQQEKMKPLESVGSVMQLHTSSSAGSNTYILSAGDRSAQPDKLGVFEGHHACKYCEKIFTTHTNKRRHERRIHEQNRQVTKVEKTQLAQETNLQRMLSEPSQQETEIADDTSPAVVLENYVECAEQYMLDVSSNISENLSFYIDGKIVSTSTVSSCEAPKIYSGSSTLVGLDALILDRAQISQVSDSVAGNEIPGQPQVKRRTATPPLLPQIKTELESEVVVSSSSSSLVSSLIENLLPPNTESTGVQKERTVFLSPKLKQLLEKQDGLKPTLALIADAQKPCSPISLSVRAAGTGRFKRRTGSPPSSPQENLTSKDETADSGDCDTVSTGQMETPHSSPLPQTANVKDDTTPHVEEPAVKPVSTESWPPTAGGNSCNQQPLDLSNTVKRNEDLAFTDAVLDLSFQKKIQESLSLSTLVISDCPTVGESSPNPEPVVNAEPPLIKEEEAAYSTVSIPEMSFKTSPPSEKTEEDEVSNDTPSDAQPQTFTKNFVCNVCDRLFHSMKELGHHVGDHADEWPYKCEFCVLLFSKPSALLDHRSSLHGVGKSYVCSACTKEFVYLCNLKQHQDELHPGLQCTYTEEEKGKLRPQNYNNSIKVKTEPSVPDAAEEPKKLVKKEVDVAAEELFTTIKIMASNGAKIKGPDVRLGINQHYPSFKPPPFPYHNRSPAGSVASATNFTTHNIPQTFTTAIRCTKCGKSFDNMPELHKHILACANASDKRRYTPKRNPIPLRHFAKTQNGVLSTTNTTNGLNASNRPSQSNRSKPSQESPVKVKFKVLNKRKKKLVQRVMPQRNKSSSNKMSPAHVAAQQELFVCPHCSREFTMRRSRTKHMAVCPKKPKEVKKRKEGGISVTKENDGRLHRRVEEKQQASPQHKTRLQSSGPAKRYAILPVQTVFSNKRSKIIIKESTQPKQESPTLNELPIVRTFNPSMRQYSRVQHGVKGTPIKITIVNPQQAAPQKDELPPSQSREPASSSEKSPTA
ncbi:PR domain zinc finger protein 2 isoform X4 [Cyclopterus lumpus]|uniref:PR domain zinc finger protein 2 isoform X4 n=1 Tax=Cyclopterus lumpus TaxID=8103 RepID=UPI0014866933|nr:PR domain zinc finger protein 2 isoform X4 [Cyclopterus lumpus]